jgi:hypothetical protein
MISQANKDIQSRNKEERASRLALNEFSDMTLGELKSRLGLGAQRDPSLVAKLTQKPILLKSNQSLPVNLSKRRQKL